MGFGAGPRDGAAVPLPPFLAAEGSIGLITRQRVFAPSRASRFRPPSPQYEYPAHWPTFFHDLIAATAQGDGVVDMFCRILLSVDEDIVSLDIPRCFRGQR